MPVDPSKVLFVGLGASAVGWYRCYLPALFCGADWVGLVGDPPNVRLQTGLVKGRTQLPDFTDYEVVVVQQPRGRNWLKLIRRLQSQGTRVFFEVDDFLHGIRKLPDHDFKRHFSKEELERLELNMRVCDGVIVSTPFIAQRYARYNRNVHVCLNGIDVGRYDLTRPPRPTVNIGWAGATGHVAAVMPWLDHVAAVMARHDATTFVSIGQPFADTFTPFPNRHLSIPFTLIDQYPAAMTMLDVALAPAGRGNFFRGKSDLRWLEAGALGIPIIADPGVYPNIEDGVTGFHASTPQQMELVLERLVTDDDLRTRVGGQARDVVRATRDMRVMVRQWQDVLDVGDAA